MTHIFSNYVAIPARCSEFRAESNLQGSLTLNPHVGWPDAQKSIGLVPVELSEGLVPGGHPRKKIAPDGEYSLSLSESAEASRLKSADTLILHDSSCLYSQGPHRPQRWPCVGQSTKHYPASFSVTLLTFPSSMSFSQLFSWHHLFWFLAQTPSPSEYGVPSESGGKDGVRRL